MIFIKKYVIIYYKDKKGNKNYADKASEAHEATKQNRLNTIENVKKILKEQEKRFNKIIKRAIDKGQVNVCIINLNIPYCSGQKMIIQTIVEAYFQDAGYRIISVCTENYMINSITIGWSEVQNDKRN